MFGANTVSYGIWEWFDYTLITKRSFFVFQAIAGILAPLVLKMTPRDLRYSEIDKETNLSLVKSLRCGQAQ
jgi:hypothetical protein